MVAAAGDLDRADSSDLLACTGGRFAASRKLRASRPMDRNAMEQYFHAVVRHPRVLSRDTGVAGGDGGLHSYRLAEDAQHPGHEADFFVSGAGIPLCHAAHRLHGVA